MMVQVLAQIILSNSSHASSDVVVVMVFRVGVHVLVLFVLILVPIQVLILLDVLVLLLDMQIVVGGDLMNGRGWGLAIGTARGQLNVRVAEAIVLVVVVLSPNVSKPSIT